MHFFSISFKNALVYRFSVIFSIFGSILWVAISIMLWRFLYSGDADMISYMTKYTIIASIIEMFYTRNIANRIGGKVADGSFVTDLIRPINLFTMSWQMELADIASSFLMRGLPVIIVFMPYLIQDANYDNIPLALLAVILGHILFLLIYAMLGFSAYILIEIWPFSRLLDDTIRLVGGSFIPLVILPNFLQSFAMALPFRFLYSFPLELILGQVDKAEILSNFMILCVWICVFIVGNIILYNQALRKAVIQGG